MLRPKFILIAFMAFLAACFTIELPFTQVNYIHLLVNKKERGITNSLKDTHRLHKTYYEDQGNSLLPVFTWLANVVTPVVHKPIGFLSCKSLINTAHRPNALRGPPRQA